MSAGNTKSDKATFQNEVEIKYSLINKMVLLMFNLQKIIKEHSSG
jgi:hypothetical protein